MNVKSIYFLTLLLSGFVLTSCGDDDAPTLEPVVSERFSNLHAPAETDFTTNPPTTTGEYVKFSFETGTVVTGDDWDIAFRTTTILVNGGEAVASDEPTRTGNGAIYFTESTMADVGSVNLSSLAEDSTSGYGLPTGSGNGWYNYDFATNIVSPLPGVIVVRTHDGKYAKMEILSYYEDAPVSPDPSVDAGRYFTFDYVFQPNIGETGF